MRIVVVDPFDRPSGRHRPSGGPAWRVRREGALRWAALKREDDRIRVTAYFDEGDVVHNEGTNAGGAAAGAGMGAMLGGALGGPLGLFVGMLFGALLGGNTPPQRKRRTHSHNGKGGRAIGTDGTSPRADHSL